MEGFLPVVASYVTPAFPLYQQECVTFYRGPFSVPEYTTATFACRLLPGVYHLGHSTLPFIASFMT